jgi:hypothetical protein
MKIIISEGEDVTEMFKEAITILNNMRHWQKEWEQEYGCELKAKKKRWEREADNFLTSIGSHPKTDIVKKEINIEQL